MAISTQPSEDWIITQNLRNDWTQGIKLAPNCIDWRNSHPSRKQREIMDANDAHMRNKAEQRKFDPDYRIKKYGKGNAIRGSFNKAQFEDLWKVRDKQCHGKNIEQLQAEKVHIINQVEYDYMHDAHKNPQVGYKPTNKVKDKVELKRHAKVTHAIYATETVSNKSEIKNVDHGLCIVKTNDKYKCPKADCDGSFTARYGCMWCELPDMFLTPITGLAWTMLKQNGKHELK